MDGGRTVVGERVQPWAGRPAVSGFGGGVLGPEPAVSGAAVADDRPSPVVWGDEVEDDEDEVPDVEAGDIEELLQGGGDDVDDAPQRDPEEHGGQSDGVCGRR